ncbi:MAG: CRISPR system precrRNA processing endoribonuclease RAMP protein Cas6 [Campylobacterales bacterium]|nr:CRISPR system precrRNA processing endoribonuclease RAMP protein Cas6 [Campylobacterales bacterium]
MRYCKISVLINDKPPYFIGSQLRGALGYALKKVTCINPSYQCEGCFALANCLYYEFYEKQNSFHPFRFDFELGCEYYDFSLYLFEEATQKLPYVVSALFQMLTQHGLGRDKKTYQNFELYINDTQALKNGQLSIPPHTTQRLTIDSTHQEITLHFKTPLRIKKDNRFVRDDAIELPDIINSVYQRQMQLLGKGYGKFPYPIEGEIVSKTIEYKELTRQSKRQKTTMNLGGIVGEIEIKGLNKECYEVLKVGELIGMGKQTVFGLGKIEIVTKEA